MAFKRGNLVKVLVGHLTYDIVDGKKTERDITPEHVGREAVIDFNYAEKYKWPKPKDENLDSYHMLFLDNGQPTWKYPTQIELVHEGGEHLFKVIKENMEAIHKKIMDQIKNRQNAPTTGQPVSDT